MELLEEKTERMSFSMRAVVDEKPRKARRWAWTPALWPVFFRGLLVMALASVWAGLATLHTLTRNSFLDSAHSFSWMVVVRGASLEADQVGAALKVLPGVLGVTFVSSEEAFQQIQSDPLYLTDVSAFEASDLPSSWRVEWDPSSVDFSLLPLFAEDVRRISGVADVAYDPRHLDMVHRHRSLWFAVQAAIWMAGMVTAVGALILLGRFFFFGFLRRSNWREAGRRIVIDSLWWLAGCAVVWGFLSRQTPWTVAFGGILAGCLHYVWNVLETR